MRYGIRAFVVPSLLLASWLLPSLAHAQYAEEYPGQYGGGNRRWSMMQGNIAGGVMFDSGQGQEEIPPRRDDFGFGSIYLGMAFMPAPPPVSMFFGAGMEGTVAGARGPYQLSLGAGTRMGVAWKWTRYRYKVPDLYVYLKFLPFVGTGSIAQEEYLADQPNVRTTGAGVRLAIGFTAPAWTAFWYSDGNVAIGGVGVAASANSIDEAAICCVGFLLMGLLNHTELTYESYQTNREDRTDRVGIRFGVGF